MWWQFWQPGRVWQKLSALPYADIYQTQELTAVSHLTAVGKGKSHNLEKPRNWRWLSAWPWIMSAYSIVFIYPTRPYSLQRKYYCTCTNTPFPVVDPCMQQTLMWSENQNKHHELTQKCVMFSGDHRVLHRQIILQEVPICITMLSYFLHTIELDEILIFLNKSDFSVTNHL